MITATVLCIILFLTAVYLILIFAFIYTVCLIIVQEVRDLIIKLLKGENNEKMFRTKNSIQH
jgi:hypothetical protein